MANPTGTSQNPRQVRPFLDRGTGEPGCCVPSHAIPVLISERPPRGLPRATRILPLSAYVIFTYPHTCACDLQKPARQPLHVQPR